MPNPIDSFVGTRVRLRRTLLGLSQERLSELMGLTFQQIQKYEKGTNRIPAGRLARLGHVLDVSPDWFFEEMPEELQNKTTGNDASFEGDSTMLRRETLELVRCISGIENRETRQSLADLIHQVASQEAVKALMEEEDDEASAQQ